MVRLLRFSMCSIAFLLCINNALNGQTARRTGIAKAIKDVQKVFKCDSVVANHFLFYLETHLDIIQYKLSQIASTETKSSLKEIYKRDLLRDYFLPDATVQVSSTKRIYNSTQKVKLYLENLSRVDEVYKYRKVELTFDPNYAKLEIKRENGFDELIITTKQYFRGCSYESNFSCYRDLTFKMFRFRYTEKNGDQELKISSIKVSETFEVDDQEIEKNGEKFRKHWEITNR